MEVDSDYDPQDDEPVVLWIEKTPKTPDGVKYEVVRCLGMGIRGDVYRVNRCEDGA